MADIRERTTHYPARYRVCFNTVAGNCSFDYPTLERARRACRGEPSAYILAQWFAQPAGGGRSYVQSERVR